MSGRCSLPPSGWFCTRDAGHDGPCAAHALSTVPTGWASRVLASAYDEVDGLRRELAQNAESGIDQALRDLLDQIEAADCELGAAA